MKHILIPASLWAVMAFSWPTISRAEAPSPRYQALLRQISLARKDDPSAFQALAGIKARMPELDRRKRGRLAPVTPRLRALGPRALLPLLEELSSSKSGSLGGTARVGWRVGLLEAVGVLRDPRATPVLRRVLQGESDAAIVRAAAAALGALGDQESVDLLTALSAHPGGKQLAVIAGMGECRRLAAARTLARLLAQQPREELAAALVRSLGEMGSAWAWETPRLATSPEGPALRGVAARALLDAFVHSAGQLQQAAESAILLVDAPGTLELIAQMKSDVPAALRSALERLAQRVAHNPLRRTSR